MELKPSHANAQVQCEEEVKRAAGEAMGAPDDHAPQCACGSSQDRGRLDVKKPNRPQETNGQRKEPERAAGDAMGAPDYHAPQFACGSSQDCTRSDAQEPKRPQWTNVQRERPLGQSAPPAPARRCGLPSADAGFEGPPKKFEAGATRYTPPPLGRTRSEGVLVRPALPRSFCVTYQPPRRRGAGSQRSPSVRSSRELLWARAGASATAGAAAGPSLLEDHAR